MPIAGPAASSAPVSARSAGSNGNSAVITLITSKRPGATVPGRDQREERDRAG